MGNQVATQSETRSAPSHAGLDRGTRESAVRYDPAWLFAPPAVSVDRRRDGSTILRSPLELGDYGRCIGEWLERWAQQTPDRPYLRERGQDGEWRTISYSDALQQVRRIASWLLRQGCSAEQPVAILSDNSIEHALLTLGALHIGVTVVPVSPAYSLVSRDFAKLRTIFSTIRPKVIFVADHAKFTPALAAVQDLHEGMIVTGRSAALAENVTVFSDLLQHEDDQAVSRAFAAIQPDTVAKILFTSGSTGTPKGVINTQRMLCSNQQANLQVWPFLTTDPPVIVDWLPWNHTFGGNFDFNMVLRHGGTLHIDAGRPVPALFQSTVKNLREVAPTVYLNVPRGYDLLVSALRTDEALRRNFFSRLQVIFYAAAALPQNLWDALEELALETLGRKIVMVSAWGSTETAPLATSCHFLADRAGVIGLPIPGTELKLLPNNGKLEVRVRGPNVTPGYWQMPKATAESFDSEGFYCMGDAVRFADAEHPEKGLLFDGRVAEDFKLMTGTWVNVGELKTRAIAALAPVAQDVVVTGHDRDYIGLLVFPNVAACRELCHDLPADVPVERVLSHPAVHEKVRTGLEQLRRNSTGSSTYASAALLLSEPASIDGSEITDKGYINQRAVLTRRSELVKAIYSTEEGACQIIRLATEARS
jgi:feruloyl-CoA synthase